MHTIRFIAGIAALAFVLGTLLGIMFASTFRRRSPGAGKSVFRLLLVVSLAPWLIHAWYALRQTPAGLQVTNTGSFAGATGSVIGFLSVTLVTAIILLILALWIAGRIPPLASLLPIAAFAVHYVFAVPFLSTTGMDLNLRVADPLVVWLMVACLGFFALLLTFGLFGMGRRAPGGGGGKPQAPPAKGPADERRPADITAELARSTTFKP